jgi:hypothetical protein
MEVIEIVSYYLYEDTKRLEITFRTFTDSEDEVRNDIINLDYAKEFGYDLISESLSFFDLLEFEDVEDDDDDDFQTIDEDVLMSFLNEYYIVYPDKLPKSEIL